MVHCEFELREIPSKENEKRMLRRVLTRIKRGLLVKEKSLSGKKSGVPVL